MCWVIQKRENNMTAPTTKPVFPNVRCGAGLHEDAPGYVICRHVLTGSPIEILIKASPEKMGEIRCALPHHEKIDFLLVCAGCTRVQGVL